MKEETELVKNKQPIGIFDSGVGGLTITKDIHALLPHESLIYFADQAYAPYGDKSPEAIEARSLEIADYLVAQGCKAIVVACNTATVNAIEALRKKHDLPIIGVEPGIKPAAVNTKSNVIGVLATQQTINSHSFNALVSRFSENVKVVAMPSPLLVELVEANDLSSDYARQIVSDYVEPLLTAGADQIALGCTHYAFLAPLIQDIVGDRAVIINTASPVAAQLKRRLEEKALLFNLDNTDSLETGTKLDNAANVAFHSSDNSPKNTQLVELIWQHALAIT